MSAGAAHYLHESRRLAVPRALCVAALHALIIIPLWGQHRVPWLLASAAVQVGAAMWFSLHNRSASPGFSLARLASQLGPVLWSAQVSGWPESVAFFVLFAALAREELDHRLARAAELTWAVALGALALKHGVK